MKHRITVKSWTEICNQMRIDSRDRMNTASDWLHGWPIGTYSVLLVEECKRENEHFVLTQDWGSQSLCKQIPKYLNERMTYLPSNPKIIVSKRSGVFWTFNEWNISIRRYGHSDTTFILSRESTVSG